MSTFGSTLAQAFTLLFQWDSGLWSIIGLSLRVSLSACFIATVIGLPTAMLLTMHRFRGDFLIRIITNTLMALPPVVVGVIVYLLLSRMGPLGVWGLLYTPTAMIIAQTALITPIVIALALPVFNGHWQRLSEQLSTLGISGYRLCRVLLYEARVGLMTVILAAFGRAIAEIGAVMIVGGNIENQTRVMTTAIAMETRQGRLEMALALGIVLILLALLINSLAHNITRRRKSTFADNCIGKGRSDD